MRDPCYTVSFGGEGDAWKILFLPHGYGKTPDDRVVWSRELRPDDHDDDSHIGRYPADVSEKLAELERNMRLARGYDAELARRAPSVAG
mgnify:CR=1 FL=1